MFTAHRISTLLVCFLFVACFSYAQNCFDKYHKRGQWLFSKGNYKSALDHYRAARQCDDCKGENRTVIEQEIEKAEEARVKALELQTKIAEEKEKEATVAKAKAEELAKRAIINELIQIAEIEYSRGSYEESTLIYEFVLRYIDSSDIRTQIGYTKALYHDQNAFKVAIRPKLRATDYSKHTNFIQTICPVAGTPFIASGGWDKEVHIWSTDDGAQIYKQDELSAFVTSIIHFPMEGKKSLLVVSLSDGNVMTFEFDHEKKDITVLNKVKVKNGKRLYLEKIADTDMFIAYSSRRDLSLWKRDGVAISAVQEILPESTDYISNFQYKAVPNSPNIACFEGLKIFLINRQTKRRVKLALPTSAQERSAFQTIAVSPDGEFLVAGNRNGEIVGWALRDLRLILPPTDFHDEPVAGLTFSRNGSLLFSSDKDGLLIAFDPDDNFRKIAELPFFNKVNQGTGVATEGALLFGSQNNISSFILSPSLLMNYRSEIDSSYLSASEIDQYNLAAALDLPNVFDHVISDADFTFLMGLGDYFAQEATYKTGEKEASARKKAERCYRTLMAKYPDHPLVINQFSNLFANVGVMRFRERNYSAARELLSQALELNPGDQRCNQYLGYLDFVEGKSLGGLKPSITISKGRNDLEEQMEAFSMGIQLLAEQGHWTDKPEIQQQVFLLLHLIKLLPTEEDMTAHDLPSELLRSSPSPETFKETFESYQFDSLTTARLLSYYGKITSDWQERLAGLPDTAYIARIAPARKLIEGLKKVHAISGYPKADNEKIGEVLGSFSYYLLFDQRYEEAIAAAREASERSEAIWPRTNLGHGYLLSGQREKAIAIYASIKDIIFKGGVEDRPFSRVLIEDFCDLSRAGIKSGEFLYIVKNVLSEEELSEEEASLLKN